MSRGQQIIRTYAFPQLTHPEWRTTRDTIRLYSQVLGKVRRATTPSRKHWWHVSLRCTASGLYTTPMPDGTQTFDLLLDLTRHQIVLNTNQGERWCASLQKHLSIRAFADALLEQLARLEILTPLDLSFFDDDTPLAYDPLAAQQLWLVLSQANSVLRRFQGEVRGETSPVQLWPHHFDLALLWLTGNLVEGQDPDEPESADEQMNFGFVTGDDAIPEPYFYVTAYPPPAGFTSSELPAPAYWYDKRFTGAILPYAALVESDAPDQTLMAFLRILYRAGQRLMLDTE